MVLIPTHNLGTVGAFVNLPYSSAGPLSANGFPWLGEAGIILDRILKQYWQRQCFMSFKCKSIFPIEIWRMGLFRLRAWTRPRRARRLDDLFPALVWPINLRKIPSNKAYGAVSTCHRHKVVTWVWLSVWDWGIRGKSRGCGVRTPLFGGPSNFTNREKTSHACAWIRRVLVLKSYPDRPPPPFTEILYPPLQYGAAS